MKVIVFVNFKELMEEIFDVVDEPRNYVLNEAELLNEGIYTTVGNHDVKELFTLFGIMVNKQNISAEGTQFAFGN